MGPAKKKTNPVIPILIVVALIAVGVGAFVLLSGDDDKGGDSPESTVEAFFDAGQNRDCEAAGELLSSQAFESFGGREAALQACQASLDEPGGLFSAEGSELTGTEVTSEDDSNATVTAEVRTSDGETQSQEINLVKEDGEWKISAFGGGGSTPPEGGGDGGSGGSGGGGTPTSTPETSAPSDGGSGGSGGSGSIGDAGPIPSSDPTGDAEQLSHAEQCAAGDMGVCDDLYWETSPGSDLETYGRTCGGRVGDETRPGGQCETEFG
jgi:hypothetical protein